MSLIVPRQPNLIKARAAFLDFMEALDLDMSDPHLQDTPRRVAKYFSEVFSYEPWSITNFDIDEFPPGQVGDTGMVIIRNIPFSSVCAHHFAPFMGVGSIAYIPKGKLTGLSKFARALGMFCAGPQVQERIGQQLADWIMKEVEPTGCAVVLKAEHTCMSGRGPKAHLSETITSTLRGAFYSDDRTRSEFMALLNLSPGH